MKRGLNTDMPAEDALRQLDKANGGNITSNQDIKWRHAMAARAILANAEDPLYPGKISEAIEELDEAASPAATDYGREKSLQRAHAVLAEIVYGR